jgi:hypothetical protein
VLKTWILNKGNKWLNWVSVLTTTITVWDCSHYRHWHLIPRCYFAFHTCLYSLLPVTLCYVARGDILLLKFLWWKQLIFVLASIYLFPFRFYPTKTCLTFLKHYELFIYGGIHYITNSFCKKCAKKDTHLVSSSFLGSTAQLRPWPPPQNPAEFLRGF